MLGRWPFLLLFLSGLSALTYQVVWMREFRLVFGASTASTGAVSALFMAGLGVGGWLLGPRADRHRHPLVLYGRFELAISILAGLSPFLLLWTRSLYFQSGGQLVLGFWGATAARLGLAAIVIGIPAFIMGGTLPAAARAVTAEVDDSRGHLGLLYGINTLGAVAGVLLTNFILLERLGARYTLFAGVAVNLAAALIAMRKGAAQTLDHAPVEIAPADVGVDPVDAEKSAGLSPALALVTAAGVGFVFFLMELVWYRMLSPLLGGSTYTFGLILAIALAGIGIGGALYPAVVRHVRPSGWLLASTCLAEAFFMMAPFALGDRISRLAIQLNSLSALGFAGAVGLWSMIILIVVFPAAIVSGIQFPLLIALMGRGSRGVGSQTGRIYASNTLGAIAGSLAGGFGLMPSLGATRVWMLCGILLVLTGGAIAVNSGKVTGGVRGRQRLMVSLLAIVLVLSCLTATGPTAAWRHAPIGAGRVPLFQTMNEIRAYEAATREKVILQDDGVESAMAIAVENGYSFIISGKSDGNIYGDRGTQIMCGMVGAALHPNPRKALVVGLGTGCTAGWLAAVESMERVDVVELEPAVITMARLCAPANQDVVGKAERGEGVRIFINDAREMLVTAPDKYDIIASEPSNPYRAGIASLFSREFYEEVRSRLTDDGIFVNWCQAYEVDTATVISILATLKSVFNYVECWNSAVGDMQFVASMRPLSPAPGMLSERLEQPTFRDAIRIAWDAEGLSGFLSRHIANDRFVSAAVQGGVVNTDDKMQVEYAFARTVGRKTSFSIADMYNASLAAGTELPDWAPRDLDRDALAIHRYFARLPVQPKDVSQEADARLRSLQLWKSNNLPRVAKAWTNEKSATRMERLAMAEALAARNDKAALEYVGHIEDWWPATAGMVKASLAWNNKDVDAAVAELESAFAHLRESGWEVQDSVVKGLKLAEAIASSSEREHALRIYNALLPYFSMYYVNALRMQTLLTIARSVDPEQVREVFSLYEPNVPWDKGSLAIRVQAYLSGNDDSLAARAMADFEAFSAGESENLVTYFTRHGIVLDVPDRDEPEAAAEPARDVE